MLKQLISKETTMLACAQLCFGIIGAILIQAALHHPAQRAMATVNVTALVDSFVHETAKQNLTPEARKQKVSQFARQLDQTVNRLAKQKHLLLVPSEAVIAGSIDITQEVAQDIKKGII